MKRVCDGKFSTIGDVVGSTFLESNPKIDSCRSEHPGVASAPSWTGPGHAGAACEESGGDARVGTVRPRRWPLAATPSIHRSWRLYPGHSNPFLEHLLQVGRWKSQRIRRRSQFAQPSIRSVPRYSASETAGDGAPTFLPFRIHSYAFPRNLLACCWHLGPCDWWLVIADKRVLG